MQSMEEVKTVQLKVKEMFTKIYIHIYTYTKIFLNPSDN